MDIGDNSNAQLKSIVDRIEHVNQEIRDLADGRKDIYQEAKSNGFDLPALKAIVSRRAKDREKLENLEMMVETYETALGEP
jgi:uncharacterized protein (UPF0335 family)